MGELIRFNETQLRQELTRQLGDMQLATAITVISSREMSSLQLTAASEVATTLKKAQQMVQDAIRAEVMTPEKVVVIKYLTQGYLDSMLTITATGRTQIVNLLVTYSSRR